ncbi:MAG: dUTP diphosphatase [Myxococcales bacterium]|nr:dUTP diphosphatase [Myxococcales bacterium]
MSDVDSGDTATVSMPVRWVSSDATDLELPSYATPGSAGMDLRACLSQDERPWSLAPGERKAVPTGLAIAVPPNYEAQIRPRSGLALRDGVTCLNTPGTIDSDYRGEIRVILANLGQDVFTINHGDRIAQLVLSPIVQAVLVPVDELDETSRGSGGFGSTGVE